LETKIEDCTHVCDEEGEDCMWSYSAQTDAWLNIGDGDVVPEEWIRISSIERVRMVKDSVRATVILRSGIEIATAYNAQALIKRISETYKPPESKIVGHNVHEQEG
jgi:hypothetical protein